MVEKTVIYNIVEKHDDILGIVGIDKAKAITPHTLLGIDRTIEP
jgi:hypothetical protein